MMIPYVDYYSGTVTISGDNGTERMTVEEFTHKYYFDGTHYVRKESKQNNNNMNLSFLDNVVVDEVTTRTMTPRGELNPTNGADLRVFADGRVYPSEALVEEFNLEYQADNKGNGFDIIDSAKWGALPKDMPRIMFISPVTKSSPKVDLFGSTKFDENGQPKSSVLKQGSPAYGKTELIPTLQEVYGITVTDHVDLVIARNSKLAPNKSGIYNIPKRKTRNVEEGKTEYLTTRRENSTFYALIPFETTENTENNEIVEHATESATV